MPRRQVHVSSYMFKVIKGESSNNFINKCKYISGGSRDGSNCNMFTPKSPNLKNFYYLGAKTSNNSRSDLRNKCDAKALSNIYTAQLLHSIIGDPTYVVNNANDFLYRPKYNVALLNLYCGTLHVICIVVHYM